MLSPILSQQDHSNGLVNNTSQSPITNVLNLAASATSLRDDFAMCEKVINEKHQFHVVMLDEMDKKIMGFSENLLNLEKRVESLEKSKDYSVRVVQDTLSEIKTRQADIDQKMMGIVEGSLKINDMIRRCGQYSDIPERIMNIEKRLEQDNTTRCIHQCNEPTEKKSVAVYGSPHGEIQIGLPHTIQSQREPCWGSDCRTLQYRGQKISTRA